MRRVSSRHKSTPICLLLIFLRNLLGIYRRGDQIEGVGDLQKVEEDDRELADEDDDEDEVPEGMSKSAMAAWEGVARSLVGFL